MICPFRSSCFLVAEITIPVMNFVSSSSDMVKDEYGLRRFESIENPLFVLSSSHSNKIMHSTAGNTLNLLNIINRCWRWWWWWFINWVDLWKLVLVLTTLLGFVRHFRRLWKYRTMHILCVFVCRMPIVGHQKLDDLNTLTWEIVGLAWFVCFRCIDHRSRPSLAQHDDDPYIKDALAWECVFASELRGGDYDDG